MSHLIDNEKIKLTANLLNTIAAAIFVTGLIAPGIAASYNWPQFPFALPTIGASLAWVGLGSCLHILARRMLEKMMS